MYTVLLVDDEPAVLSMGKRTISSKISNFKVIGEAFSVRQAKEIFTEYSPDVILTDIKMPNESGIELIKYVTSLEDITTICIAISGYSDFNLVHDAFVYGAYDYLLKPVIPKKMVNLFSKIERLFKENESHKNAPPLITSKMSSEDMVLNIKDYVIKNIACDNSISSICNKFGINQPYLSKIFKKHKECTYNDFLINLKIEKAQELLILDECYLIREISESLGFSDQFYFSKVFKNKTGLTPSEYRNKNNNSTNL